MKRIILSIAFAMPIFSYAASAPSNSGTPTWVKAAVALKTIQCGLTGPACLIPGLNPLDAALATYLVGNTVIETAERHPAKTATAATLILMKSTTPPTVPGGLWLFLANNK